MVVAFHPELTSLNYFTQEQINFIDTTLVKKLKDIAFDVGKRKCKKTIGQIICIKKALVKKTLLKWFNKKYRPQFNQISAIQKLGVNRKIL